MTGILHGEVRGKEISIKRFQEKLVDFSGSKTRKDQKFQQIAVFARR